MKAQAVLISLILSVWMLAIFVPQEFVQAQDCGVDSTGNPIPCPTEPGGGVNRKPTITLPPPVFTFTPTSTQTSTPTATATRTATAIPPTATNTFTPTVTHTLTATPLFSDPSTNWLPGAGIGAFLLLIVVVIFLPAVQKIRVSKRGY